MNSTSEQEFITRLTEILEANFENEHFGVSELAKALGMSRSNLHRKIIVASKISANQYIRQFRLQKGLEILKQTSFTVSEVSYKVGFSSPSYFIKCFHDYYGYSPGGIGNRDETETDAEITKSIKKRLAVIVSSVVFVVLIVVVLFMVVKPFSFQLKELEKSIAVLPFRNDSPDSTDTYINGLMESIVTNLSLIGDLDVRSRTSVENYRGSNKSLIEIAKELKVNYIVEGSGQKIGNEILLTIQLLEAKTDRHILSKEYRKEITEVKDFFDLRNEVAFNVVAEIKAKITPEEEEQIKQIPTENLEAHQYYLRGLEYMQLRHSTQALMNMEESHKNRSKAKYQFERAIAMDSTFVEPYVRLGSLYIDVLAFTRNIELSDAYLDSGLIMAEKAILFEQNKSRKITFNMAWAYGLKATYYLKKGRPEKAMEYYKMNEKWVLNNSEEYKKYHNWNIRYSYLEDYYEAIKNALQYLKLKPDEEITAVYIIETLVMHFTNTGYPQRAEKYAKQLLTINNDSITYLCNLSEIEICSGNFDASFNYLNKAYHIDSTNTGCLYYLTLNYVWQRKFTEAYTYLQMNEKALFELHSKVGAAPPIPGFIWLKNGYKKEATNEFEKASNYYLKQIEFNTLNAQGYYSHLYLAQIYSVLNEKEKSLEYLKELKKRKTNPLWLVNELKDFPMFDNIRNEPEFADVLKDVEAKYQKEHKRVGELLQEMGEIE